MPGSRRESDTCRDYVLPRLKAAGWDDEQIVEQFPITDGRVIAVGQKHRRDNPLRADYVLEYRQGVPVGVVEAKREYDTPGRGCSRPSGTPSFSTYHSHMPPMAGALWRTTATPAWRLIGLHRSPSPSELWARYRAWKGIVDDSVADGVVTPFNRALRKPDGTVKEPRYYQRIAINRAVEAIIGGDGRLLITMATGTGKTFVAMQIVWKLWQAKWREGRNPRVLYLADRNILIDQPIEREFKPAFGPGDDSPIWKLRGSAKAGREIYFALYQQLADTGDGPTGMFRDFRRDFFDPGDRRRMPPGQRAGGVELARNP